MRINFVLMESIVQIILMGLNSFLSSLPSYILPTVESCIEREDSQM